MSKKEIGYIPNSGPPSGGYFKTNGNTLEKKYKEAISEQGKEKTEFNKEKKHRKKAREYYRRIPLKKRGEKCKKRKHADEQFKPKVLSNGDTKVELFTRARHIPSRSGEKQSESRKARAEFVCGFAPQSREAHSKIYYLFTTLNIA